MSAFNAPARHKIIRLAGLHLLLLSGVALFLFPFAYMVATSLKTDEELNESDWLPAVPHFEASSPRVRPTPAAIRPAEAPPDRWDTVLPQLQKITRAAVNSTPLPVGADSLDANAFHAAVTDAIITRVTPRLNLDLWSQEPAKLIAAYKAALTLEVIADAMDDRFARLELRGLQVRTLPNSQEKEAPESQITLITPGKDVASTWHIDSGDAHFVPAKEAAILRYRFASSGDPPIVLRCEFDYREDPKRLHKLMLALKPDDSWHQVDATLDFGGIHWVSQKTKYLGSVRPMSILFQPPSFDDTTDRKRVWVPLRDSGPSSAGLDPRHAVLRVTLSPSSTVGAIAGKVQRNYQRAFESVPFWRYIRNSLIVVVLATLGTMFSSSFVAYAFARLNWPGRTVAFAILLSTIMLPKQVTMIPSFMVWRSVGLYNTLCPLWLPMWFGTAFSIFLMVQYMRTIPRELEEAARIDGASVLRTWAQIILPEIRPALAAIAIMAFIGSWNEFMEPLIYLRDQSKFPLSLGLYGLRLDAPEGGIDWTMIMAGNVMMTLPVVIVFFLFQRYFIQGMTMSGMKG